MAATKVWTLDELHSLPDDGNKYELVHGELFVTPAPTPPHEAIAAKLNRILVQYVAANNLGEVFSPRSVVRHAGSEVEPDLMVRTPLDSRVDWERQPVPILVVEIGSPSTRRRDREQKRDFYREVGIRDYWIVDPEQRTITQVGPGRPDRVSSDSLTWHPHGAPAPLVVDVQRLWD